MSTAVPAIIVFRETCEAHALAVRNGAEDLRERSDALQNFAQAVGIEELGGQDAVQQTIAEALISEAAQPSNGFDEQAFNKSCDDARAEYERAEQQADATKAPALEARDAGDDTEKPPPRRWLLGNQFCRRFLSSLVAPGRAHCECCNACRSRPAARSPASTSSAAVVYLC